MRYVLVFLLTLLFFDADFPRKILPTKLTKLISVHYKKYVPYSYHSALSLQNQIPRILLFFSVIYIFVHI